MKFLNDHQFELFRKKCRKDTHPIIVQIKKFSQEFQTLDIQPYLVTLIGIMPEVIQQNPEFDQYGEDSSEDMLVLFTLALSTLEQNTIQKIVKCLDRGNKVEALELIINDDDCHDIFDTIADIFNICEPALV